MLSDSEIARYHADGYVVPGGFRLSEVALAPLRAAVEAVQAENPEVLPDRFFNAHLDGGSPYGIKGQKAFHDIAHDPRILDLAEAVMGPDLILLFTHLFCKPPSSPRVVPWHQDGPFWPVQPMRSVTVWLAIDRVDAANGAMRVIPGSHLGEAKPHHLVEAPDLTLNRELDSADVDESRARHIELEPGQVSLHDIGLVHGSAANRSGRRRAGLALRYTPSSCAVLRSMPDAAADWSHMPVELVRGVNRNSATDFAAGDFGRPW